MRPTQTRVLLTAGMLFLFAAAPRIGHAQWMGTQRAGDVIMVAMPVGTLAAAVVDGDGSGAGQFLIGFGVNAIATQGIKVLTGKERPDGSDNLSFPSGHTSIAFQSAAFLHLRHGVKYGVPAYVAAAFVGYSRVYARKHFVEDVLAGAALGVLSSVVFTERRKDEGPDATPAASFGFHLTLGSGMAPRFGAGLSAPGR